VRFIDLDAIAPHVQHYLPQFEAAGRAICREPDPAKRRALITKYRRKLSAEWTAVRRVFEQHSARKCWYADCSDPGADNELDHYRPKAGVRGNADHPGYYWLAYDWRNLRLSCPYVNRRLSARRTGKVAGKGAYFPLLNPDERARTPNDDIGRELPALLDPTNAADAAMVTFAIDGHAELSPALCGDATASERFKLSQEYLNLNCDTFIEGRLYLHNTIRRLVRIGNGLVGMGNAGSEFKDAVELLETILQPTADFATAARVYASTYTDDLWVQAILTRTA
jgi:hypothetical protein